LVEEVVYILGNSDDMLDQLTDKLNTPKVIKRKASRTVAETMRGVIYWYLKETGTNVLALFRCISELLNKKGQ